MENLGIRRRDFLDQTTRLAGGYALAAGIPAAAAATSDLDLYRPGERGYETARSPFNSDIQLKPAIIAGCESNQQVAEAVRIAREKQLPISVKSRGHSFEGFSLNDGGMVIELSRLSQPSLSENGRFRSGPGITLGDVYSFLLPKGRLLPAGSCSGVGLGGLTLGGGYGLFAREHGLTCDLLERVTMVDGRGRLIDSNDDPDLLWACRGGGNGNFGAITLMEFRTVEAPPLLTTQSFKATRLAAREIYQMAETWFSIAKELPDQLFSGFVINGNSVTVLLTSTASAQGPAFREMASALTGVGFSTSGARVAETETAIKRYYGSQKALPFRNFSGGLADEFSDYSPVLIECLEEIGSRPGMLIQFNTLGGKISRGASGAYPHRSRKFLCEVQAYWRTPEKRNDFVDCATRIQDRLSTVISSHYRNYPSKAIPNWEQAYYGENYAKLQALKSRYDPDNLFRHPQSVRLPEKPAIRR